MAFCSWEQAHENESTRQLEVRKTKSNRRNAVLAHLQAARAAKGVAASRPIQMPTGFKVDEFNNVVKPSGKESDESESDSFSDSGYKSTLKPTKLSREPAASTEQAQANKKITASAKKQPLIIDTAVVTEKALPHPKPHPRPRPARPTPPQALWVDTSLPESRKEKQKRIRREGFERKRRMRLKRYLSLEEGEIDGRTVESRGPVIRRLLIGQ
jgi:hypothetical protein